MVSCWTPFLNTGRSDILLWTWAVLSVIYGMSPTDYAYVCVNRVSIDPVIQCCTSAKLCCGFMNILYYSGFCNVVQKHWFSKWDPAVYLQRWSDTGPRIGRTEQGGGHQNHLAQISFLERCVRKSFVTLSSQAISVSISNLYKLNHGRLTLQLCCMGKLKSKKWRELFLWADLHILLFFFNAVSCFSRVM